MSPPQCVEIFLLTLKREKVLYVVFQFARFIHYKILPMNIFALILKNKMATTDIFQLSARSFVTPSRTKGIIGKDLKFTGYVYHYKIFHGNNFGHILNNRRAATSVSFSVMKQCIEIFLFQTKSNPFPTSFKTISNQIISPILKNFKPSYVKKSPIKSLNLETFKEKTFFSKLFFLFANLQDTLKFQIINIFGEPQKGSQGSKVKILPPPPPPPPPCQTFFKVKLILKCH